MDLAEAADRVGLAARARALTEALRTATAPPAGRLLGLPELPDNDYWLDTAGVTALTGIRPKTISSWLARGGPVRNPFPVPQRFLYRLYWRGTCVSSWLANEPDAPKGPISYTGREGRPGSSLSSSCPIGVVRTLLTRSRYSVQKWPLRWQDLLTNTGGLRV